MSNYNIEIDRYAEGAIRVYISRKQSNAGQGFDLIDLIKVALSDGTVYLANSPIAVSSADVRQAVKDAMLEMTEKEIGAAYIHHIEMRIQ